MPASYANTSYANILCQLMPTESALYDTPFRALRQQAGGPMKGICSWAKTSKTGRSAVIRIAPSGSRLIPLNFPPDLLLSELHLTRLCRTEPVAPARPCADLVGAASRRKVLGYMVGDYLFPHNELSNCTNLYRWRFELARQYTGSIYMCSDIIKYIRTDIRTAAPAGFITLEFTARRLTKILCVWSRQTCHPKQQKILPRELSKRFHLANHVWIIMRLRKLCHRLRKIHSQNSLRFPDGLYDWESASHDYQLVHHFLFILARA
jgi:hypothetical protein